MNSEMMLRSAPQWLAHWAAISPDRPALVIENEGTIRYGEWAIAVARMAKWLRGAGVQAGMLVGIESANQYLHAVAMLGAETVGAYTVSFSSTDIADGDSAMQRCDWLLHEPTPNPIAAAGRRVQINQAFIDTLAAIALTSDDLGALQKSSGPNTIVRVQRSSGTTGEKKSLGYTPSILSSHAKSNRSIYNIFWKTASLVMFYDFCSTPGYIHLFFSLHNGQLFYITNLASFNRIVESVPSFHVVAIQGHLPALIANYTKRFDLAPQRSLHVIGAEVPADTWAHLVPIRFGRAMNAYGASEVLGTSYSTMGAPYSLTDDTEMQIVDADGNPVAPGDTGMIEVRNPRMVDGYLWNADLTQRHFVNGWFRTFDIGRMPTPQTVIVTGRADDMLNIGGIKVMPHMYEEKLRNVAGITDAVVISIPDKNNISRMHVICEGDRQTIDQPFADIVSKTLGQTGFSFHLHCVKTLPRTETGKVQRNALKEKFADM